MVSFSDSGVRVGTVIVNDGFAYMVVEVINHELVVIDPNGLPYVSFLLCDDEVIY